MTAAIEGPWRSDADRARDAYRHPLETLEFFEVEPNETVLEIWPGGGWYTAILAPYLSANGTYIAAGFDPASGDFARNAMAAFQTNFVDMPETFGDITVSMLTRESGPLAPEGSVDTVLTFRNIHNWMAGEYADKVFADMYAALKPGGTLGVVEHRLPSANVQDPGASTGYVHEDFVKELAEDAGFIFVDASEINANPKDTADHPGGVWTLPPNLRSKSLEGEPIPEYDAATYTDIGESDRMTLKFRKPTAKELADAAKTDAEE